MDDLTRLDESIVTSLRRIIRAIDLHSRDLLQNHGLTAPQLMTLQELSRLQPVAVGTLAAAVHVSQATMTGILDRLEQRDLVQRVRDVEDRRSVVARLTKDGAKFLETAPSLLQSKFREELARLEPWEQTTMLSVLQRIATMMGAADLTAAPILVSGPDPLLMQNAEPAGGPAKSKGKKPPAPEARKPVAAAAKKRKAAR